MSAPSLAVPCDRLLETPSPRMVVGNSVAATMPTAVMVTMLRNSFRRRFCLER